MAAVYNTSKARQSLAALLEQAAREGEVRIQRKDGQVFVIRPLTDGRSPLDVGGVDLHLSREEIVSAVREGRRAYGGQDKSPENGGC